MPIISAVGLFCCDKFEETSNEKVSGLSKLTKPYFKESEIHVKKLYNINQLNICNVLNVDSVEFLRKWTLFVTLKQSDTKVYRKY